MALDARTYVELLMQEGDLPDVATLIQRPDWTKDALCKEHPEVCFFPGRGESSAEAKAVCAQCSVRAECFDYVQRSGMGEAPLDGVWAGFTTKDRKRLREQRAGEHLTLEQALEVIPPVVSVPIGRQASRVVGETENFSPARSFDSIRPGLESRSEIPNVSERTDSLGRRQPAAKPERKPSVTVHTNGTRPDAQAAALPSCEGCGLPISRKRLSGRCRYCEDEAATG